ncbi:hypothetical protein [Actinacidiphila soli]|uniref:hypothetical protein n=1 Tax=Actinacidiphila soli TaxID=2487275 RepID=UPI0019CFED62|nr:hypothetical protein [Actinacidiphila soli]
MKHFRSYAAVAGLTGAAVLAMAIPAQAAEGTWSVYCNIKQQVQLQGSPQHDYMRWYTTGNSQGCEAWIYDSSHNTTKGDHYVSTTGSYYSSWYYDGPGYYMDVCVNTDSGVLECGPYN